MCNLSGWIAERAYWEGYEVGLILSKLDVKMVILKLIENGVDISAIADATGLTEKQVVMLGRVNKVIPR